MSHTTRPILLSLLGLSLALSFGAAFWYRTALAEMVINAWQGYKLTDGLVGYWSFDAQDIDWTQNKAFDRSGQGNHGVFTNMATATAPVIGKVGQGMTFDGSNDYVTAGNPVSLQLGTGSVSAWIKTSNAGANYRAIATKEFAYGMYLLNDVLIIFDWTGPGAQSTGINVADGTWHHVIFTFRGGVANGTVVYLDGVPVLTTSLTISNQIDIFSIGDSPSNGQQFNGTIDEVRVYNRALSAEEVKRLYLVGSSMKVNASQNQKLTDGLVGLWSFDARDVDWTQNKAFDRSSGANHGVFVSMSTATAPVIGKVGQAIQFDGVNDYVNVGDQSIVDGATAASVCLWLKYDATSVTQDAGLVTKWDSAAAGGWLIWVDDVGSVSGRTNTVSFSVDANAAAPGRVEGSSNLVTSNQWDHYCGTFQGGSFIRLYKNGALDLENTTSIVASVKSSTNSIYFANSADSSLIKYLDGSLDDVRVYNRALSAEEIKRLYLMGGSFKINAQKNAYQTDGLAALWSFDAPDVDWTQNKALDRSSGANHGVFVNMSTTTSPTFGKIGQGIRFDKVDDYINLGTDTYQYTNNFTYSAWVNTTGATSDEQSIISTWGGRAQFRLETDVRAAFYVFNGGDLSFYGASSSIPIAGGEWHHLVAVKSSIGTGVRLYVDGVLVDTNSYTGNVAYASGETHIGGRVYTGAENDNYFSGSIDDVRIYSRALLDEEIKRLYLMGR